MSNTALRGTSAGGGAAAIQDQNDDQNVEYEVEKLLAHSYLRGRKQFLVKWKGYPVDQSTWEPMEEMDNCIALLMDYDEQDFIRIMKNTKKELAKVKQKAEPKKQRPTRKTKAVPTYVMVNDKEYSPVNAEQKEFLGFNSITWENIERQSSACQEKQEQVSPTVAIMDLSDDETTGRSISSVAHTDEASQEAFAVQAKPISPTVAIAKGKKGQKHESLDDQEAASLPPLGTGETESVTSKTNANLPCEFDEEATDSAEEASDSEDEGTDDEEATDSAEEAMAGAASGESTESISNTGGNLTVGQIKTQLRLDKLIADLERTISQEGLYLNLKTKKRGWRMPETSKPYGVKRCLQLKKIHNCLKVREHLFFCVTWKGCRTMDAVPLQCIKYLYPELIIQFLETLQRD